MAEVFAKSEPRTTLRQHTEDCLSVFRSARQLFSHLPKICGVPEFFEHLFYAIFLHDIGKAASGFQAMLLPGGPKWGYRHEVLSAGYINSLTSLDAETKRAVALAIITHHKGIAKLRDICETTSTEGRAAFVLRVEELKENFPFTQEFLRDIPRYAKEYLGYVLPLPEPPESLADIYDAYQFIVSYRKEIHNKQLTAIHSTYGKLLRGLTIACDHLASSGREEVRAGLNQEFIEQVILLSRSAEVVRQRPNIRLFAELEKKKEPTRETLARIALYPFQQQMMSLKGSAFLSAPTGSGKTEASLLWAGSNQDSGRRIFYVLPYTASINAMSKRLSGYFGEDNVGVLHGKASYFIYTVMCERNYSPKEAAEFARDVQGLTKKLYRPLKILTPFQILKAFFGMKGWESLLAEMAGGLFIFDEIHVYDAHLTALILKAIEHLAQLDAKFLFLSATFPKFLKERINNILPNIQDIRLDESKADDNRLMNTPRHRIELLDGEIPEHIEAIQKELKNGKRVLVVCNTVKRAQAIYPQLESMAKSALLLHGRFILRDREQIERKLDKVQLLVGTQAVEVSLDLDFDILFTEPAAIDALIQRFGRVNRSGKKGVVSVYICTQNSESDNFFYDIYRISKTLSVLQSGEELTEKRVNQLVEQVYEDGYNTEEQETFDNVTAAFEYVINNLYPFDPFGESKEQEFYNLIKSVEVVPGRINEGKYLEARNAKQYFEAIRYYCNVTLGQKAKLEGLKRINERTDSKGGTYYFADAKYTKELGLLIDEIDTDNID